MTIIEGQLPIGILVAVSRVLIIYRWLLANPILIASITDLFSSIASAALVTTGSAYMVASVPFLVFNIWALQQIYLCTSRQFPQKNNQPSSELQHGSPPPLVALPIVLSR